MWITPSKPLMINTFNLINWMVFSFSFFFFKKNGWFKIKFCSKNNFKLNQM
jgi:hypothetical protein